MPDSMKSGPTLFLKAVLLLTTAMVLFLLLLFPKLEGRAKDLDFVNIYKDPFILYIYLAFTPFFAAFYQAFKLLGLIERNKTFSKSAVRRLRNIKHCALGFMGFIALAILFVIYISRTTNEDGAGAVVIGGVMFFASSVIATAAGVFEKLLQSAVRIKSENDLTV